MSEIELVGRFERVGFPHDTALRLVSVLSWIQISVETPNLLKTISSLEDTVFSVLSKEAEGLLGLVLSSGPNDNSSFSVSKLQALVDASRNGPNPITGLFGDREKIRAFVDEKSKMISKSAEKIKVGYSNADAESPASSTHLNPAALPFIPLGSVDGGTEDERCLYLTFSKGHPLTSPEIIEFFTEMCNNMWGRRKINPNVVKTVYIHKGEDGMALFGKVVFCNPYLPGFILGKQKELKFVVNGNTLWCKRFVRKNSRNNRIENHRGGSSTQVSGPQGGVGFGGTWFGNSWGGQFHGMGGSPGSSHLVWPHGVGTAAAPGLPVGQFLHTVAPAATLVWPRVVPYVGPPPPQGVLGVPGGGVMIGLGQGGYLSWHGQRPGW